MQAPASLAAGVYDLHTHSRHSDGTDSVPELVAKVAAAGLSGFALTDHDSCEGWAQARACAALHGVDFLPGIELTTKYAGQAMHLLGYGCDSSDSRLQNMLRRLQQERQTRLELMITRLEADFPISREHIAAAAGGTVGRPHLADELVRLGVVDNRSAAFQTVLAPRSKYYVPGSVFDTVAAIKLLRDAGGAPVLAHPAAARNRRGLSAAQLREFLAAGLLGVEVRHPENSSLLVTQLEAALREVAGQTLLFTGSSDYHGKGKVNRLGQETTPAAVVAQLRRFVAQPF